jgi:hypothetical protein
MLGGLGHTSLVGSYENLRGPNGDTAAVSVFFFFAAAWAENGEVSHIMNRSGTTNSFEERIARKGKCMI